jgi:hypothetical protein
VHGTKWANSLSFVLTLDLGAILGYFSQGGSPTAEEFAGQPSAGSPELPSS